MVMETAATTDPFAAAPWMREELTFRSDVRIGDRGPRVRIVQELLNHHGLRIAIDGIFGPATRAAVSSFGTDVVNQQLFDRLRAPFVDVLGRPPASPAGSNAIMDVAHLHLAARPREIGGANMGPWVRLYMEGREGASWPWCAGFVSTIMRQAALLLGRTAPLDWTMSCDLLAADARARGRFIDGASLAREERPVRLPPGSIFLIRRRPGDWVHTGFVTAAGAEAFETVEGNTNDQGDREGYEVCSRIRGYDGVDFVLMEMPA